MSEDRERQGLIRANACYFLAAAGLILLDLVAPFILKLIMSAGIDVTQIDMLCLLDGIYYIPCILLPVCLYALRNKSAGLRLGPVSIKQMLQSFLAAYLCVMLANSLAAIWSMLLEAMGFVLYNTDIAINDENDLMKAIFAVAVLPGICEELLFRGLVLGAYERGGTRRAIFISAILFASLHGTVQGFPVQLVMGIVLGFAACSTGSVYVSMMIHTAYNAFLMLISYMFRGVDTGTYASMYDTLGGVTGVITVVIEGVISASLLLLVLRSFARQGAAAGVEICEGGSLRMDKKAALVLAAGIIAVGWLYGQDIMLLLGYQL